MSFEDDLSALFSHNPSGPFLFVGSGFSRRYIGLETWETLLERFCVGGTPFAYYKSSADGKLPKAASLLSKDFHELWWKDPSFSESREKLSEKVTDKTSPLRLEISQYVKSRDIILPASENLEQEIELLKGCNVDGVITTNWDLLLENLFPKYKVYIGQGELLFSNPLNIGEIYKIHGCSTRPESLVLTAEDYSDFNDRNTYLASKLITIFVEHPIVFIGYRVGDDNIQEILRSIAGCIGNDKIHELRNNLIFLDRNEPSTGPTIEKSELVFGGTHVPFKVIKSSNFAPVYEAIRACERKLPAHVLRFCKERVFDLVQSSEASEKLAVMEYEEIEDSPDVEVVFGIGIRKKLGEVGYKKIKVDDVCEDVLLDKKRYDPEMLVRNTIPEILKSAKYVPVFKYLRALQITSTEEYHQLGVNIKDFAQRVTGDLFRRNCGHDTKNFGGMTFREFFEVASDNDILFRLPLVGGEDIDVLEQELRRRLPELDSGVNISQFRKVICFLDWKKYGFYVEERVIEAA
ncbi:SIR2 family protein [Pseudovibrio sp. Tun.PSC04-5.I4]|uniref:SIR2 family protein n=1 Tax=Pseudovibrio sp. Tun.PSC04-5.I4 TaxID=1798213 RepID=UPI00088A9062|nr:SIR2 family protein [Pseudovibrio sp. Tun.PSC04-5.I4]SDR27420.1 SIR2-like domain-containing protein [Pseudovibrio sp. Tun.PSC04-5.I4]